MTFETKITFSVILYKRPGKVVCSQNEQFYHVKPCNKHVYEPKAKNIKHLLWGVQVTPFPLGSHYCYKELDGEMKSANENYPKSSLENVQKSLPFRKIYIKYLEKNSI